MNCLLSGAIVRIGGAQKRADGVAGAKYSSRNHRMRVYSRNSLANPYTSRIEMSCSASMLVILIR